MREDEGVAAKGGNMSCFPMADSLEAPSKLSSWAQTLLRKKKVMLILAQMCVCSSGNTLSLSGIEDLHSIFMNSHNAIVLQFLIDCLYVIKTTNMGLSEWLRKVSCHWFSLTQAAKVAGWIMFCCMLQKAQYLSGSFFHWSLMPCVFSL